MVHRTPVGQPPGSQTADQSFEVAFSKVRVPGQDDEVLQRRTIGAEQMSGSRDRERRSNGAAPAIERLAIFNRTGMPGQR